MGWMIGVNLFLSVIRHDERSGNRGDYIQPQDLVNTGPEKIKEIGLISFHFHYIYKKYEESSQVCLTETVN